MLLISSIMKKTRKSLTGISYAFTIRGKSEENLWSLKTFFKTNVNKV